MQCVDLDHKSVFASLRIITSCVPPSHTPHAIVLAQYDYYYSGIGRYYFIQAINQGRNSYLFIPLYLVLTFSGKNKFLLC